MELMAFGFQTGAEGTVVFDDPGVDQCNVAGLVEMRMGVRFGRRAVGGPPGVGNAGGRPGETACGPIGMSLVVERGHLAGGLADDDGAVLEDGEASGVIAAVFEPPKAVDKYAGSRGFSDVSDDAAHG